MKLSMLLLSLCVVASQGRNLRKRRETDSTHVGANDWSFSNLFESIVQKIQDEKVKDGFNRLLKDRARNTLEEGFSILSINQAKKSMMEHLQLPVEPVKELVTEGLGNLSLEHAEEVINEGLGNLPIKQIEDTIIESINNLDIQHIKDTVIEDVSNVPIEKFKDTVIEGLGNLPIDNLKETVGEGLGNLEQAKDIFVEGLNNLNFEQVKDTVIESVGNLPVNFVRETVSEGLGNLAIEHVKASVLESLNNINIDQVKEGFGNFTLENAKDTLHAYADKIETLEVITDNLKNISTNGIGFDDLKKLTAIIPSNLSIKDGLQAVADLVPKTVLENEELQGYYKDIEGQFYQLGDTLANFFW